MKIISNPKLPTIEGTHIRFIHEPELDTAKTHCWEIYSKYDGSPLLGRVAWFGKWTKYAFFPWPETVYEQVCLRDIAQFCEDRTREQRQAAGRIAAANRAMKNLKTVMKEAQKPICVKPLTAA